MATAAAADQGTVLLLPGEVPVAARHVVVQAVTMGMDMGASDPHM